MRPSSRVPAPLVDHPEGLHPEIVWHVLQQATPHRVAAPEQYVCLFPRAYDFPYGEEDDDDVDLSNPFTPRFHGCDVAQKAELRLHPYEATRVARAGAKRGQRS